MDLRGKALLGVDIGTHSVKIVEIRRAYGGGVILVNYDIQEIQRSGDRAEADAQGPIVTAIRSILERQGIKTRRAVCVIGGQEATVRRILLPPIPEKEWPEAIAWEARNQAPLPLEQCAYDYHALGKFVDRDGIEKTAVLLAIASQDVTHSLVNLCREAGLQPVGLTIIPVALWNLILRDPPPQPEHLVHLDIGGESTQMLFLRRGKLEFTRETLIGGEAVTQALTGSLASPTSRLDLDEDLAEALKREIGIPPQEEGVISYRGQQIPAAQVAAMLRPSLERLLGEIYRSLDYYREQFRPTSLEGVTLSGGGSLLKNLLPFLREGLGTPVERIDPFRGIQVSSKTSPAILREVGPHLATAIGLALEPKPQIDLLPPEIKREGRMKAIRSLLRAAAISLVLSLAFLFLLGQVQSFYYKSALSGRKIELSNLRPLVKEWERMTGAQDATSRKLQIYEQLVLREPMMYGILKEISRLTPKEVQITEISFTRGKPLLLKALAFSSQGPEGVLTQYMGALSSSPFFADIDLHFAKEMSGYNVRTSQFELALSLR